MADIAEVTFGQLQSDARYKKLERLLKLSELRKASKSTGSDQESWALATSCSMSTINPETSDFNSTAPNLHTSKIGSEVVSSSNNLRQKNNLRMIHGNRDNRKFTTSSVKQYNQKKVSNSEDHLLMPPPHLSNVLCSSNKLNKDSFVEGNKANLQGPLKSPPSNNISTKDIQMYRLTSTTNTYHDSEDISSSALHDSVECQNVTERIFTKWRVLLNQQEQLIIKGTLLQCGKVARSKAVIRRLNATTLVSVYNTIYRLQGNIIDERHGEIFLYDTTLGKLEKLPEYVRGKFHNGFPDDWESVHQVWRSFVIKGSSPSFRWPTHVTDSDDDLKSEMTDISFMYCNPNDSNVSEYPPGSVTFTVPSINKRSSETSRKAMENIRDRSQLNISARDTITERNGYDSEQFKERKYISSCNSLGATQIDRLKNIFKEDPLNFIINKLTDDNCSQEYIDKLCQMFDCLSYLMPFNSFNISQRTLGRQNESVGDSNAMTFSQQEDVECKSINKQEYKTVERINETSKRHNYSREIAHRKHLILEMQKGNSLDDNRLITRDNLREPREGQSDYSESETYAGIPKISMERIFRQKDAPIRPQKRKIRRKPEHTESREYNYMDASTTGNYFQTQSRNIDADVCPNVADISITESEAKSENNRNHKVCNNADVPLYKTSQSRLHKQWINSTEKDTYLRSIDQGPLDLPGSHTSANKNSIDLAEQKYFIDRQDDVSILMKEMSPKISSKSKEKHNFRTSANAQEAFEEMAPEANADVCKRTRPTVLSTMNTDLNLKIVDREFVVRKLCTNSNQNESNTVQTVSEEDPSNVISQTTVTGSSPKTSKIAISEQQGTVQKTKRQSSKNNSVDSKNVEEHATDCSESQKPGTLSNPKLLSAWAPRVITHPESADNLGLVFEGKLLNESGHVVDKRFTTDIVLKRESPILIETVKHEYYQLVGNMCDAKHVIPRKMLTECRRGCPSRLNKFCKMWMELSESKENVPNPANISGDTTMDALNVPMSSKGRRIMPPLSYWTGERITLRDNVPVYTPGSASSSFESPKNLSNIEKNGSANARGKKKQNKNMSCKSNSLELEDASTPKERKTRFSEGTYLLSRQNVTRSASKYKRGADQKLSESGDSSEAENSPVHKKQRVKNNSQSRLNSADTPGKGNAHSGDVRRNRSAHFAADVENIKPGTTRAGKMVDNENTVPDPEFRKPLDMDVRTSTGRPNHVQWSYYQEIPSRDIELSDDQLSHI